MTGSISRPTGGGGGSDPTKLAIAANLSDLASAPTARTNLGLGGAATLNVGTTAGTVAAGDDARIVNSPRWDAPQTLTVPQEAQLRANIGFADTYTTAQLLVLDATTSKRLAFAYCSDCINSGSSVVGSVGAFVRWSEASQRWMTFEDNAPVTTDFLQWAVWMHLRTRTPYILNPFASHFSIMPPLSASLSAATTGVAGSFNSSVVGTMDMLGYRQSLSSGAGIGSVMARFSRLNQSSGSGAFSASMRRSMAVVATVTDFLTSVSSTDNIAYRFGLQTEETAATAWPNTFCGFVFDDTNAWTTPGASGALRAVVRVTGTDIYVPTTIGVSGGLNSTVTANALCVAVIEPTGLTTARFRVGYQIADGSFVTAYDGTQSLGGSPAIADLCPQAHFVANKTVGTTSRAMALARASASFVTTAGNLSIPYRPNFPIA